MTLDAFLFGIGALLLAPGPTNTLMALAGAQRGFRGLLRLLPAELAGYLTTILPLVWLGQGALGQWPAAVAALKLAAAAWVMVLAIRLWETEGGSGSEGMVTAERVYLTTMLNPKALIFGLVFLPVPPDPAVLPRLAAFCGVVVTVALIWGTAGGLAQARGGAGRLRMIQRAASLWLAAVSVTLAAGAVVA